MEEQLRRDLVRFSQRVHAAGWVANHDGNLSVRLGEGRFLCTPTAVSKAEVTPESLIVVDGQGNVLQGTRKPFSEMKLHIAAYRARPKVAAVLHAHPPTATGFAVAGIELGAPFMPEPVVSLGDRVPLVPYAFPGSEDESALLVAALRQADAVLLANHGALSVGPDLETCFLRLELVEHLCKIALVARQVGSPRPIPGPDVQVLMEKREKAGLGPRAEGVRGPVGSAPPAASLAPGSAAMLVEEALRRFQG
ncbi:MAG: class II aldolase/adducin family protein [Pseudomonadota bacterium]